MKMLSQRTLRYVDENPAVKAAIMTAAKARPGGRAVTLKLADFDDLPFVLWACLEFARHELPPFSWTGS